MSVDSDQSDPQPNESFARDLRALYRADVPISESFDAARLRDARVQFARRRSRSVLLRIGALVTAAAAVIVIVVHFAAPPASQQPTAINSVQPEVPALSLAEGRVDIVDALKLAKRIRAGDTNPPRDDVNHDGAINQLDVDAIAMAAVKLAEARVQ